MREEKRVYLAAIRREMQNRYQYESREKRNHAFEVLYHGWRQQEKRRGRFSQFFTTIWRRGWVNENDAIKLRNYIGLP